MRKTRVQRIEFSPEARWAIRRILGLKGETTPRDLIELVIERYPQLARLWSSGHFHETPEYSGLREALRDVPDKFITAYFYAQYPGRLEGVCPAEEDRKLLGEVIGQYPHGRYTAINIINDFLGATPRGTRRRRKQVIGEHA